MPGQKQLESICILVMFFHCTGELLLARLLASRADLCAHSTGSRQRHHENICSAGIGF